MAAPIEVRRLTDADAPACVAVASTVGWAPPEENWRWMFSLGDGWGVDVDGALAGTAVVFRFDDRLAMLAMMMVRADMQKRGLGALLLRHARSTLSPGASFALYASTVGERLYRPFGFVDAGAMTRFEGEVPAEVVVTDAARPLLRPDLDAVVALDARAQGASRRAMIASFVERSVEGFVVERAGEITGFGLGADENGARRLGPIVADRDDDAVLIASVLGRAGGRLRIDPEPGDTVIARWAVERGLAEGETSPRLVQGGTMPGARASSRAIAGRPFG